VRGDETFDVFLSYARSDELAATELNNWLRGQGFRTFFDRSELRPGLPWVPALEEAINRSHAVAILFGNTASVTPNNMSASSPWFVRPMRLRFQLFRC
jgi:hypothetical protein